MRRRIGLAIDEQEGYGELIRIDGSDHRWFERQLEPGEGRVEIPNRKLQNPLVKELRLANICDMSTGNASCQFMKHYNKMFSPSGLKADGLHRRIVENKRLSLALTIIKAQRDHKKEPKIKTKNEKTGYKKDPRQLSGPNYRAKSATAIQVKDELM